MPLEYIIAIISAMGGGHMPDILNHPQEARRHAVRIELNRIICGEYQPRTEFDEQGICDLAQSIRRFGLLSPLLVRRCGAGKYELIAGERRLRALKRLNAAAADAIVLGAYDLDCALIALIENIQRENLHFLDEAEALQRILTEHGMTQEALAAAVGRSPSALNNLLRLLRLNAATRNIIRDEGLTQRHARALLQLEDAAAQQKFAQLAADEKWSVHALEVKIAQQLRKHRMPAPARIIRDNRLIVNAISDTVRSLRRIGVSATSRVEDHDDYFDVIVTVRAPQAAAERA